MYRIYLFGLPRVEKNEITLQVSRRKAMGLLAFLAASGQYQSRETLATLFYSDQDQSSGRNYLRRDLSELRAELGKALLLVQGEQVSLIESPEVWIDVREFHRLISQARQHCPASTDPGSEELCEECQACLTGAIDLYSADFLAGFSLASSREFDEWSFFQAESLRREYAEALQALIRWQAGRGEYEAAISYARRWLALDPLHEPAQRQLMRLYAWSGQQSAALRQFQEAKRLLQNELGMEPEEETTRLFEAIRNHDVTRLAPGDTAPVEFLTGRATVARAHHNLPRQSLPLIGRVNELQRINTCLREQTGCRLLTLVGPGGIGKTTLAIEAAHLLVEDPACPFCEGIYWVPLVQVTQPDSIIQAIAEALKLPLVADPQQRTQQLMDYLQSKRVLLVLDNFEHLISASGTRLLTDLLATAPDVKLLVTSRTRLNAQLEHILTVGSLDTPDAITDVQDQPVESVIAGYSAVQLFEQQARRLLPDFKIHTGNLAPVVRICQMTQGMPLGIELAAAWLGILTPDEIVAEIAASLDFLSVDWPDLPERQHNLRAVFNSSWKLLEESERSALMYLSVFQGSFSRQAARQVSAASLQLLMALHNKSWLQALDDGRYQIHELLRQYLDEKLKADPDTWQDAMARFTTYYAGYLEHQSKIIKGWGQKEAIDEIAVEFENIRLAWGWLVEHGQIGSVIRDMLFALFRYAEARGKSFELMPLIDQALQAMEPQAETPEKWKQQAILLTAQACFNKIFHSERLGGIEYYLRKEPILQAWRLAGDTQTLLAMGFWGTMLANLYGKCSDYLQGETHLREMLPIIRLRNDRWELANTLLALAAFVGSPGDNPSRLSDTSQERELIIKEALALFDALKDRSSSAITRGFLGNLYFYQKRSEEAVAQWQLAYKLLKENGEMYNEAGIAVNIATGFLHAGDFEASFQSAQDAAQTLVDRGYKIGAGHLLSWVSINAVRHSDLEYARRARLQSLICYEAQGAENSRAWGFWEMGEIQRVAGDLAGALEWFEKARDMFEELDDPSFPVFYRRGLGELALAAGNYVAAQADFLESVSLARQVEHEWAECYGLLWLGQSQIALGETKAAWENFTLAIRMAKTLDEPGMILNCLAAFATYFASLADFDRAIALGSFVLEQHFTWNEVKAQINALLQSPVAITPEDRSAAEELGRHLDLDQALQLVEGGA